MELEAAQEGRAMIRIPKNEPLNVVPFIDIMLVVLALVLSISTFIAQGEISVELPRAQAAAAANHNAAQQRIQIDTQGTAHINGKPVSEPHLKAFIHNLRSEERVVLQIDKNVRFERFVTVIDLLKAKQHENFSIATESPRQ